jgi:hypothetical protein
MSRSTLNILAAVCLLAMTLVVLAGTLGVGGQPASALPEILRAGGPAPSQHLLASDFPDRAGGSAAPSTPHAPFLSKPVLVREDAARARVVRDIAKSTPPRLLARPLRI